MPRKAKTHYAVAKGRKPGIYTSWPEAESQVFQFPGAVFKGFFELDQAQEWLSQKGTIMHTSHGRYFRDQQGLSDDQRAYNALAEIRQIRAQHGREAAVRIREQMGIEDLPSPEPLHWPDEEATTQRESTPALPTAPPIPTSIFNQDELAPDPDLDTRRRRREDDSDDDEAAKRRRHASSQRSIHERLNDRPRRSASPERKKNYRRSSERGSEDCSR